jgi:Uma2 family endonuclease
MACDYDLVMAAANLRNATFADLEALGVDLRAEIIHGSIVEKASPTMEHGRSQASVSSILCRRFDRRPGGRWPGGWWLGTEVDVEYETHELYCHDVVGWRRDRVPECPRGRPIRIRPDWVCEMLSPSNEKRDLIDKMGVLQRAGVPHYWIGNPQDKTLVVHRWEPKGYAIVLAAASGDVVRAEPFEAIELRVDVMFGDADDDD